MTQQIATPSLTQAILDEQEAYERPTDEEYHEFFQRGVKRAMVPLYAAMILITAECSPLMYHSVKDNIHDIKENGLPQFEFVETMKNYIQRLKGPLY